MKLSIIVAQSKNRVIGMGNKLPWRMPADLAHFKKLTMGKPIVMGRKTYESIGRPLPGRKNIVITRNKNLLLPGCEVFHALEKALEALGTEPEVMVIGGANLYAQCINKANALYVTEVDTNCEGDAFFPEIDLSIWKMIDQEFCEKGLKNDHACVFQYYERV